MSFSNNNLRFPCERMTYTKTVGQLLPTILGEIFTELGYEAQVNPQQSNGVDLQVYDQESLVFALEILNWGIGSKLNHKRRNKIVGNLREYGCSKLLVYTVPLSRSNIRYIEAQGIDTIRLGYQVLPRNYYEFFLANGQCRRREADSDATRRGIAGKVMDYLS